MLRAEGHEARTFVACLSDIAESPGRLLDGGSFADPPAGPVTCWVPAVEDVSADDEAVYSDLFGVEDLDVPVWGRDADRVAGAFGLSGSDLSVLDLGGDCGEEQAGPSDGGSNHERCSFVSRRGRRRRTGRTRRSTATGGRTSPAVRRTWLADRRPRRRVARARCRSGQTLRRTHSRLTLNGERPDPAGDRALQESGSLDSSPAVMGRIQRTFQQPSSEGCDAGLGTSRRAPSWGSVGRRA